MKPLLAFVLVAFAATALTAGDPDTLLARALTVPFDAEVGAEDDRDAGPALGFACFDDSDWTRVLDGVHEYNARFPERAVRTIVL